MLAFLRVVVFYIGLAAFLTWGLFALGWADALEMPGFEGSGPVAGGSVVVPGSREASLEPKLSQPRDERSAEPARAVVAVAPAPTAPPRRDPLPAPTPEPEARAPGPARTSPELDRSGSTAVVPPPQIKEPALVAAPPPTPNRPAPAAQRPTVAPAPPAAIKSTAPAPAPLPPVPAKADQPSVRTAPSPKVRKAAPAVTPRPAVAPSRAPPAASKPSIRGRWAPQRRVAGIGVDDLASVLDDTRRGGDDIACVMLRKVVFKAGSRVLLPSARTEFELAAQVLATVKSRSIEIGSKLGPGRPMASDAALRIDRATIIRNRLIDLGVPAALLVVDSAEGYERVAADVSRAEGSRAQSMGICVLN